MEFGNGRDAQFDPYAGKSVNAKTGAEQRGLKPAQQTQVLRQLFGVNYESKNFLTEAEGAKALEKLRNYDTRGAQNRPIILQLDQGDFNHAVTFERVRWMMRGYSMLKPSLAPTSASTRSGHGYMP